MKTMFDSVDLLGRALSFHRDRHATLAGNIANIDTPGYQPVDLAWKPATAAQTESALPGAAPADETNSFLDPSPNAGADGNAVSLEREMAKVAANKVRYSTASELATRRLALLRYGATDGNG